MDPWRSSSTSIRLSHHRQWGTEAAPASAYGYVLVNGIPRWNNRGHLARTETSDATRERRKVYKREWTGAENALPAGVHMRLKTRL